MKENIEIQKPIVVDEIFHIVKSENKHVIVVGQYIVSKKTFDDPKLAIKYIKSKPWELICNVTTLLFSKIKNNNESENEKNN